LLKAEMHWTSTSVEVKVVVYDGDAGVKVSRNTGTPFRGPGI